MTQLIQVNQITSLIVAQVRNAIGEVAKEITEELYNNLTGIYMYPRSEFYERTNDFLNALIKPHVQVTGNEVSVTIGMDASAIISNSKPTSKNFYFGEHSSFDGSDRWKGESIGQALLSWWDTGTTNSVAPSLPQTDYWYDVFGDRGYKDSPNYQKLDKLVTDKLYEKLSRFGAFKRIHSGGD